MITTLSTHVDAAKFGDTKAFEALINACKNTVTSIALSVVKDVDASEEVAQQVFINCWQNLDTLTNAESFLAWVRQTTRYKAINYLRDNKVDKKIGGEEAEHIFSQHLSEQDSWEDNLSAEQHKQIIGQLIDQLPSENREIVLLYYREGESSRQVATLLEISEASVRKKLSRSRAVLKEQLLRKFGQSVALTAPTIAFTSLVVGSLTTSTPAVASVGIASKGSLLGKLPWLFSGAMLSAVLGALAIFGAHKLAEKQMTQAQAKTHLRRLRNIAIAWVCLNGLVLAAAYQFTQGALAPILSYSVFAIGLAYLIQRMQWLINTDIEQNIQTPAQAALQRRSKLFGKIGLYAGLLIGFIGLFAGLLGAGRL